MTWQPSTVVIVAIACLCPLPREIHNGFVRVIFVHLFAGTAIAGWSGLSSSKSTSGWGPSLTKTTTWQCTTCLINNQPNISTCVACGSYKPGTQSSLGDLTKGKQLPIYKEAKKPDASLIFGTSKPATPSSTTKTVNSTLAMFGAKSTTPTTNATPGQPLASTVFPASKPSGPSETKDKSAAISSANLIFPSKPAVTSSTTQSTSDATFPVSKPVTADKPAPSTASSNLIFGAFGVQKPEESKKVDGSKTTHNHAADGGDPCFCKPATDQPAVKPIFEFGSRVKAADVSSIGIQNKDLAPKPVFAFGAKPDHSKPASGDVPLFGGNTDNKDSAPNPVVFPFGTKPVDSINNKPASGAVPLFGGQITDNKEPASKPALFAFGAQSAKSGDKKPVSGSASLFGGSVAVTAPASSSLFAFKPSVPSALSSVAPVQAAPTSLFGSPSTTKRSADSNEGHAAKKSSTAAAPGDVLATKAPVFGATPGQSSSIGFNFTASSTAKPTFQFGNGSVSSGGLFGGNSQPSGPTSGGLFGSAQPTSTAATPVFGSGSSTVSVFGGASTAVFGSSQPASSASSTPVFGSSVQANTSMFGSGAAPSGLFGSTQPSAGLTQPASASPFGVQTSGGLFQSPAPTAGGLFGGQQATGQTEGQGAAASAGGFSVGANVSARTVKRAVRRIKKP